MKIYKNLVFFVLLFVFGCQSPNSLKKFTLSYSIPLGGNCWILNSGENAPTLDDNGISKWKDTNSKFRAYFKTENSGKLDVALLAKSVSGTSEIELKLGDETKNCKIENSELDTVYVGTFDVSESGYQVIDFQGIKKSGEYFPEVEAVLVGGEAAKGNVYFARDEFYWAKRGPSVHLNFVVPENTGDVEYFYNEITVPEHNDVLGSYFMADGFGQGYFGMQVNSETERRVLFSVWSPYKTDNPGEIPDEFKIKLLKKGDDVHSGEFGDEGSGGQSYFVFPWKAGTTYKYLLKGQPTGKGETDFTAWFFAPEANEWKLIASFRRPKTDTYLTHLYSFLENFLTETGNIPRMAHYSNQWVCNTSGKWIELTNIKFTADATARKESRMDYAGGTEENYFFLKNCGFFDETTTIDTLFERKTNGNPPVISFSELP